jgi:hypothetical protein
VVPGRLITPYDGYNEAELKRLLALHPRKSTGATS